MKLSSSQEKATYPCLKKVYRVVTENKEVFDVISLDKEELKMDDHVEVGSLKSEVLKTVKIISIRLLNSLIDMTHVPINESRAYVEKSMSELPSKTFDLQGAHSYKVVMTQEYLKSFAEAFGIASMGANK